jgi:F0F1-type ATP synthase assembly protein I
MSTGSGSAGANESDGTDQVWGLISTLVAGPAVWGAIGYGVDRAADTAVFTPIGVVVGFVTAFYVVYAKMR